MSETNRQDEEYLSVKAVAELCHVDRRTVTRWLKSGTFPGAWRGVGPKSPYRIPQDEVEAFIARRARESGLDEGDIESIKNHGIPVVISTPRKAMATISGARPLVESSA